MITGDYVKTAIAIARNIGILHEDDDTSDLNDIMSRRAHKHSVRDRFVGRISDSSCLHRLSGSVEADKFSAILMRASLRGLHRVLSHPSTRIQSI